MKSAITIALVAIVAIVAVPLFAQITATISGTVTDQQGALLPGVEITLSSPASRRGDVLVISDDRGHFEAPGLQAGTYTLHAELPGFQARTVTGIVAHLNQNTIQNVQLSVGEITTDITVQAQTVNVRSADSDLQEVIDERTIENIPLNGRQFLDLTRLNPGVARRPSDSSQGSEITVFGERSIANSFLVDGLDNNNPVNRNFSDFFIQDAIQEFQILLGGYQAEFGRAQGAVTNVITKSGTNNFHGNFFYFFRDSDLDSSNIEGQDVPALDRDEVGGTIGGPIWKDHTFFFYAFQYLDQQTGFDFDRSVVPQIILDGYFTPTLGGEPFDFAPFQEQKTHFFKLDQTINDSNTLFFSFSLNRGDSSLIPPALGAPSGTISLPSTASVIRSDSTSYNFRHTGFFNPTTFLESSFRFSQIEFGENDTRPPGAEQIFPITHVPSVTIWASNGPLVDATLREQDRFQWAENFSYISGNHSLKFGVDILRNELVNDRRPRTSVILGLRALDEVDPEGYKTLGLDVSMQRGERIISSANKVAENADNQLAFFAQDSIQAGNGLTLNFGLRWDYSTLFDGSKDNLAPRVGLAWDVENEGKTIIRASYGRFYDQTLLQVIGNTPSLGGIQDAVIDSQIMPRGGAFFSGGLLQSSTSRVLANVLLYEALLPSTRDFAAGACQFTGTDNPFIIYDTLGIPVPDPSNPPILQRSTISGLTGGAHTPESALAVLNATFSPAANAAAFPNCTDPGGNQFFFLQDTGSASINTGEPLQFRFRQLQQEISNIQTIVDPTETPYTDSFNVGFEQALGENLSLDVQLFVRRSRDLLTRRVVNLLPEPIAASCAGNTVDQGPCIRELEYIGFLDSNSVTVSLNKRFSANNSFLANYTYTDATDNFSTLEVPPAGQEVSFLFNNRPELDIGRSLNTPAHNFVLSGLVELPFGFVTSGVFRAESGRPFNAVGVGADSDGDDIFDNRLFGTEKGAFETDPFYQVDFRVRKNFNFGESVRAVALIEFFNLFNRANPFEVNRNCGDTDGDGFPDAAGCSAEETMGVFGQVIRPFNGREVQLGFKFEF